MVRASKSVVAKKVEDVVDDVVLSDADVSDTEEVEEAVVEAKKARKAKAAPKKKVVAVDADASSDAGADGSSDEVSDSSDTASGASGEKKTRKPRQPMNLQKVMDFLNADKPAKAKEALEKYIEKFGVGGKKTRVKKVTEDGVEKKLSDYQMFIKTEMAKIKESNPESKAKDRMCEAVAKWNEKKAEASAAKA